MANGISSSPCSFGMRLIRFYMLQVYINTFVCTTNLFVMELVINSAKSRGTSRASNYGLVVSDGLIVKCLG